MEVGKIERGTYLLLETVGLGLHMTAVSVPAVDSTGTAVVVSLYCRLRAIVHREWK